MRKKYDAHFEDREDGWTDRTVSASERRILFARWLSEAWNEFIEEGGQKQITRAFQACGMLNAMDGSEDVLIRVPGIYDCSGWSSVCNESESDDFENVSDWVGNLCIGTDE